MAGGRKHPAESRWQKSGGKWQKTGGRRQVAGGRKQVAENGLRGTVECCCGYTSTNGKTRSLKGPCCKAGRRVLTAGG